MMKVVQINLGNFGSTGSIMRGISNIARDKDVEIYNAYPDSTRNKEIKDNDIIIEPKSIWLLNQRLARLTGLNGCFAFVSTLRFINKLKKLKPDVIHFHNLHDSYINLPMLFNYVKKNNVRIIWTLHDCWAFTGRCPHYQLQKCDKWQKVCGNCSYPLYNYPPAVIDLSTLNFKLKKKLFKNIKRLTIVTPSKWLANEVKKSFLSEYKINVINNGIDLSIFHPYENKYDFGFEEKKIIVLGVAFDWGIRKGLDVFIELSKMLDEKYQIVLVGTSDEIDKELPKNIMSIHRTQNQLELALLYSSADIFVNPTREDNFPTVNIESLACGTPVITFNTGGSPEIIDEASGEIVECDDVNGLVKAISKSSYKSQNVIHNCVCRAAEFNQMDKFSEYVEMYE